MRRTSWEASRSDRHDFASTRARAPSSASVSRAMDRCSSALRSSSIRSRKMRSTVVRSTCQENSDADFTHIPRPPACGGARRLRWGSRWPSEPALAGMRRARHLLALSTMAEPVPAFLPLDHRRLDVEYAALGDREPSTEALAVALFGALAPHVRSRLEQARLLGVRVAENEGLWADRREGGAVEVTRAYAFSAAHRLADP